MRWIPTMSLSKRTRVLVRQRVRAYLNETCLIERELDTVGDMGEPTHVWGLVDNAPCRIIGVGRRGQSVAEAVGGQEALVDAYRLILPAGTDLATDYRVTVGERVYQVVAVDDDLTDEAFVSAIITRARSV